MIYLDIEVNYAATLRRFKGRAGVILACSSRHVLGLNSCRRFDWWWLRFDVIQDFLDQKLWGREIMGSEESAGVNPPQSRT